MGSREVIGAVGINGLVVGMARVSGESEGIILRVIGVGSFVLLSRQWGSSPLTTFSASELTHGRAQCTQLRSPIRMCKFFNP